MWFSIVYIIQYWAVKGRSVMGFIFLCGWGPWAHKKRYLVYLNFIFELWALMYICLDLDYWSGPSKEFASLHRTSIPCLFYFFLCLPKFVPLEQIFLSIYAQERNKSDIYICPNYILFLSSLILHYFMNSFACS